MPHGEHDPQIPLLWPAQHLDPAELKDSNLVPVPIDELHGKGTIGLQELYEHAAGHIPPEFPEALRDVAASLEAIGKRRRLPTLGIFGPAEGDYYIKLPPIPGEDDLRP